MDGENVTLTHFSGNNNINNGPPFEVHVLVVDDDATTLEITLEILTSLNYKAEGINHPLLALERLGDKEAYFDLIVVEVHMPHMDAFKMKQRVDEEFQLPLIIISVDKNEKVMEKALKSGIVRYIVKPATTNDFKGIWQFAITAMKGKKPLIAATRGSTEDHCVEDSDYYSWRSESTQRHHNKHLNSSSPSSSTVTKKTKVVWTNDLQTRFLEAINTIGLENAVPKKILEVMKTPGLTRENVASHLQKYRLFLKRVARTFAMVMNNVNDKEVVLTNLASKYPSLMLKNIQEEFGRILSHSKMRTTSYPSSYKKPSTISHQFGYYEPSNSWYNHPSNFSSKTNPIPINPNVSQRGSLCDQIPISNCTNLNARFGFDEMKNQMQPFENGVFSSFDYGCNSLIDGSNYSYSEEGGLFPTGEDYNANMENIVVRHLNEQQQQGQYQYHQLSDEEFCQTFAIGDNKDLSHLTSNCSHFSGIGINSKFSDQHENQEECSKEYTNPTDCVVETTTVNGDSSNQHDQEVAGKGIDPSVHSNDYFPSFDQISDQLLENMNLLEFEESFKELEQIPQDWDDDFDGIFVPQLGVTKIQGCLFCSFAS